MVSREFEEGSKEGGFSRIGRRLPSSSLERFVSLYKIYKNMSERLFTDRALETRESVVRAVRVRLRVETLTVGLW